MQHELFEVSPADDLLSGAKAIARFLFGGGSREVRRVYHMIDQNHLPTFRVGRAIYARKSVLLAWIAGQEGGTSRKAA